MNTFNRALSGALTLLTLTAAATLNADTPWNDNSDPFRVNPNYTAFLKDLPLSASLPDSELPWSGPYWADRKGSIAYRWQTGEKPWEYELHTREQILESEKNKLDISKLSPAEKFDILRGNYDFPLMKELRKIYGKDIASWRGICTGWAQASLHFDQPKPVTLQNPDGINVPFGSGDIKALASYYYDGPGEDDRVTARIGKRCNRGDPKEVCRRDVNAGAFHIVLTNRVGIEKKGLLMDRSPRIQVWQHPIYSYESRILGQRSPRKDASPLAIKEVHVKTTIYFGSETAATLELSSIYEKTRVLNYWLELDTDGQIVGGRYTTLFGGKVPDYIWTSEPIAFSHGWEILNTMITPKGTDPVPSIIPGGESSPEGDNQHDPF